MGEYAEVRGVGLKLGTMDDWRYVRWQEAARWRQDGALDAAGVEAVRWAMDASDGHGVLWRFPFPWEDEQSLEQVARREMFESLTLALPLPPAGIAHRNVCVSLPVHGGGYGVNVAVPCPYTLSEYQRDHAAQPDGRARLISAVPGAFYAKIEGERAAGPRGRRTIFACLYCEAKFSITAAEAARIEAPKYLHSMHAAALLERIIGVAESVEAQA